jgi:hypothetical protein
MKIYGHLRPGTHYHYFAKKLKSDTNHRGSTIYIDNTKCVLKENGEWTASRVELTSDFTGDTNLDAAIQVEMTADAVKRRSPKKNKAAPVASRDIMGAVAGLEGSMSMFTARSTATDSGGGSGASTGRKKPARKKSKIPLHLDPSSAHSTGRLSPAAHTQRSVSSLDPHRRDRRPSSPFSTASTSGASVSTYATLSSLPALTHTSHLPVTIDNTFEPAQIQMVAEIESLSPERQMQMRADMNVRMAERVSQNISPTEPTCVHDN